MIHFLHDVFTKENTLKMGSMELNSRIGNDSVFRQGVKAESNLSYLIY